MKAKDLKAILVKFNKVRDKGVRSFDMVHFISGKIMVRNFAAQVEYGLDHSVSLSVDYMTMKKSVQTLKANDEVKFFQNEMTLVINVNNSYDLKIAGELVELSDIRGKRDEMYHTNYVGFIDTEDVASLRQALKHVTKDEMRPAMQQILVGKDIVATDGHTLYSMPTSEYIGTDKVKQRRLREFDTEAIKADEKSFTAGDYYNSNMGIENIKKYTKVVRIGQEGILFRKEVAELIAVIPEMFDIKLFFFKERRDESCRNTIEEEIRDVELKSENWTIYFKELSERFPDYKSVIPSSEERNHFLFTFNKAKLIELVDLATSLANQKTYQVKLQLDLNEVGTEDKVGISSEDMDNSTSFDAKIPCTREIVHRERYKKVITTEGESEEVEVEAPTYFEAIGFNGRLLSKCLDSVTGEEVTFKLFAANRAALINDQVLIMPVMLNNTY